MEHNNIPDDAWDLLSHQLTETRRHRMLDTVKQRLKNVRLVVQDVHQPHNVSACIRSAEAFGVQNIEVVTMKTKFDTSTVARGVDNWVDLKKHGSVEDCVASLHRDGFIVASAFPTGNSVSLSELPIDKPIALVFGNEHEGLDSRWRDLSDVCFTIPMAGIVESLNISVCAAISMYDITQRVRNSSTVASFKFNELEQKSLLNKWICRQITSWPLQLKRLRT